MPSGDQTGDMSGSFESTIVTGFSLNDSNIHSPNERMPAAYLPLGAVDMRQHIGDFFRDKVFWGGLTYGNHAIACATALALVLALPGAGRGQTQADTPLRVPGNPGESAGVGSRSPANELTRPALAVPADLTTPNYGKPRKRPDPRSKYAGARKPPGRPLPDLQSYPTVTTARQPRNGAPVARTAPPPPTVARPSMPVVRSCWSHTCVMGYNVAAMEPAPIHRHKKGRRHRVRVLFRPGFSQGSFRFHGCLRFTCAREHYTVED